MSRPHDVYIHGSAASEQGRLSILNEILNAQCIQKIGLTGERRVLDVGSGLGQMSQLFATAIRDAGGSVLGIERDTQQLATARKNIPEALLDTLEFRKGDVYAMPLSDSEWGEFDIVHCRFVLEHLREPQRAVHQMFKAVRPEGRIILIDDDHSLFRVYPDLPVFSDIWKRYAESYRLIGNDPFVGRKLVTLLQNAGCHTIRQDTVFFGSWSGSPHFSLYVENMAGLLTGAEELLIEHSVVTRGEIASCVDALRKWAELPDASMWYVVNYAEGAR